MRVYYTITAGDRGYQIEAWEAEDMSNKHIVKGFRGRNISEEKVSDSMSEFFGANPKLTKVK
jgi:hypothetical protein